jgi:PAS domain S-box-containing protein
MALSREITAQITDILKEHPNGLSITDIVKKIDINRNTAGRYLENLLVSGQVEMRHFGMAKIYALSDRVPQSAMLSISSDLVIQLDSSLRIVFVNEPFLNTLRMTAADLLGKNIEYSAAGPVFNDAVRDFIPILKTGILGTEWHGTLALNKGDRFYSCHITPMVLNDGRKGVSVLLEDLTELRHRELALQESESRLRSIISAAPVGIGVVSERVILEANERLSQMTGYSTSELIGKSARILYPTLEEFERIGRDKYALIDQTGSGTVQTKWKKKDGSIIDILLSSAPIDPADLKRGVTFTALDITERTRVEAALRESEERYRKLVEISPDAVILHREGKIIYVNTAAEKLIGALHPEEIIGKPVFDFIEPGFREVVRKNIQKDLDGEQSPLVELQMLRLDGTSVIVEGRGGRMSIEGQPAVLVAVRDITERKHAEEKLKESEQKYRFLAENSLDIINRQTPECILTYVSPVVTPVLGYSEDELLGRSLLEMVHPDDLEGVQKELVRIISNGIDRVTSSFRFRHHDGHYLWFESTTNVIRNELSGEVLELFSISRDISERKAKEDALRTSEERYRRLIEQSFDAVIIHKEGKIVVANEAALAIAGVQLPEDLLGRSIYDFIHPVSRNIVEKRVAALENTDSMSVPLVREKFIRPDGRTVDVEVMATRFTEQGIPAIQVVFREISDNNDNPAHRESKELH